MLYLRPVPRIDGTRSTSLKATSTPPALQSDQSTLFGLCRMTPVFLFFVASLTLPLHIVHKVRIYQWWGGGIYVQDIVTGALSS